MQDLVLQACGTLEAAMAFCYINKISISDTPIAGNEYVIPDNIVANKNVLRYIARQGTVLATLNEQAPICAVPGWAALSSIPNSSTIFWWDNPPGNDGYEYIVNTEDISPEGHGTFKAAGPLTYDGVAVTGLALGVEYHFWLRTVCSEGHYSNWISVIFTTVPGNLRILLKPDIEVFLEHSIMLAGYDLRYVGASGFINCYALDDTWPGENRLRHYNDHAYMLDGGSTAGSGELPMESSTAFRYVRYGAAMAWVDDMIEMYYANYDHAIPAISFKDVQGNICTCAPLVLTQYAELADVLIPSLEVQLVGYDGGSNAKVRIIRSHGPIASTGFELATMAWLHDAVGGNPDPSDPLDPNKIILLLPGGVYTFGVQAHYSGGAEWPPSIFTMVVELY